MLGPARSVRAWGWDLKPERRTVDGTPFRIGSPDLIVTAIELEGGAVVRLTASFYVGRPAKSTGSIEFHGDAGSLALGSFQDFDATVEVGAYGGTYEPVPLLRPGYRGTAWARGVADMASAIREGRPHRATGEQAAHVVDILEAAAASIADGGRRIEIDVDLRGAGADALGGHARRVKGDLQVGDCFDVPGMQTDVSDVQHRPCTEPHTGEVFFVGDHAAADGARFTDALLVEFAGSTCVSAAYAYLGMNNYDGLDIGAFYPLQDDWEQEVLNRIPSPDVAGPPVAADRGGGVERRRGGRLEDHDGAVLTGRRPVTVGRPHR